ncbi:PLP-dependent transferase [Apiospora marii]|uniref:PLP-dependent transferase n=2 Tax=Apiospora marii TaxID=335849 RepID=A0ABR1RCR7_9PEZI
MYRDAPGSPNVVPPEQVLITQGAISANHLVFYTLVGPGDHVICVYPTYQQLYAVPESLGAEVSLWELQEADGWIPDVGKLKALVKDNTKMIVVNNPNNPTGATTPRDILASIVEVARKYDIIVLSDEVYRPLFHRATETTPPPSMAAMGYEKVVVTSSLSKAWALAGIRVGWVASPNRGLTEQLAAARDYTTISVSQLDDQVARYALHPSVRGGLLSRNLELAVRNLALLSRFVEAHRGQVSWVKPTAGTTAFIRFNSDKHGGDPVEDVQFCRDVLEKTKVMLVPGSKCFGHRHTFQGYVRMGYVCETAVLEESLTRLDSYLKEHLN